jgi:hypothetical protein
MKGSVVEMPVSRQWDCGKVFDCDEEDPEFDDGEEDLYNEEEIGDGVVKVFGDFWGFV